eukprot:33000_1
MGQSLSDLCSCGCSTDSIKRPKPLSFFSSDIKQSADFIRSPTFLSKADADGGSSEKSNLSTYIFDDYQSEQLHAFSLFRNELIPFFDIWDTLQQLSNNEYVSFCCLFYSNLSRNFRTHNAEGFLSNSDASKSGEFILNQIDRTVIKFKQIYDLISEPTNINKSESYLQKQTTLSPTHSTQLNYAINADNKNEAISLIEAFTQFYRIHLQLGVSENMFDESCISLEKSFDEITKNNNNSLNKAFTLAARGGLRIFFEVTRALMLQSDLTEVQNIFNASNQGDKIQSLITHKKLIKKFMRFWDFNVMESMNNTEKQLFSLTIYSFMIKKLQDDTCGIYQSPSLSTSIENTNNIVLETISHDSSFNLTMPSKKRSMRKDTDAVIMDEFHLNYSFITTFSVGIISWLNYLISFIKFNHPSKLFIHLRNTKRTYQRMGVDINILQPLLYAFKAA